MKLDPKKIKAIGIDIDGTLINSEEKCTLRTQKAINKAQEKGLEVILITGRPFDKAVDFAKQCSIDYVICNNGSSIWEVKSGKCLVHFPIGEEHILPLYKLGEKYNLPSWFSLLKGEHYPHKHPWLMEYKEAHESLSHMPLEKAPLDEILKILWWGEKKNVDAITQELNANHPVYVITLSPWLGMERGDTELSVIEVMNAHTHKGHAFVHFLKTIDISIENAMCFGDEGNDIGMLEMAGWGVAMGNAPDRVKSHANDVTLTNDEDGVAHYLEKHIL